MIMVSIQTTRQLFRRSPLLTFVCVALLLLTCLSACGPTAGIFQSTGTWQQGKVPKGQIYSLATDPTNAQHIYAGTANGSVLLTTDGGQSWQEKFLATSAAPGARVHALGFNGNGKRLYAATDTSLSVSTNGGLNWQAVTAHSLPSDAYTALAFSFDTASTLFVGTAKHGVFTSTDDGTTWQALQQHWPANTTVNNLSYVSDSHQLWAATSSGIYLSSNDGAWQAMNSGLPAAADVNAVAPMAFNGGNPQLILAATSKGFYRSVDGGAHWAASKDSLSAVNVGAVLVDFRDSNLDTVYAGTAAGVLVSHDQGQTWSGIAPGMPQRTNVQALAIGATNNAQIFVGADSLYLYPGYGGTSGGTNWLTIIIFIVLFGGLYYIMQQSRRRSMDRIQRNMAARLAEEEAAKLSGTTPTTDTSTTLSAPKNSQNGHKPEPTTKNLSDVSDIPQE